jgi:hypothetical protein
MAAHTDTTLNLSSPTVEIDPIIAAIELHRVARAEFEKACTLVDSVAAKNDKRRITLEDRKFERETSKAESDALDALAATVPTTLEGMLSALKYLLPYAPENNCLARYIAVITSVSLPFAQGEAVGLPPDFGLELRASKATRIQEAKLAEMNVSELVALVSVMGTLADVAIAMMNAPRLEQPSRPGILNLAGEVVDDFVENCHACKEAALAALVKAEPDDRLEVDSRARTILQTQADFEVSYEMIAATAVSFGEARAKNSALA